MNPQKHQQGLLRLEMVRARKVIDALLEGWTESSRVQNEENQRLVKEVDQASETIRDKDVGVVPSY